MSGDSDASHPPHQDMHIAEIRELARRYSPDQLEECINRQLSEGDNPCDEQGGSTEEIINVLAKAEFVRARINEGMSLGEAIRELGRRIRAAQGEGKL